MERNNLNFCTCKNEMDKKKSYVNGFALHVSEICTVCAHLPGSMKSEQFSPDSTALQSILQNEGVKAGGFVGATPRNSVRPSGRGTSIYTVCIL